MGAERTKNKIIVVDIDIPELLGNRLFDAACANKVSHTLAPIVFLYNKAKARGITLVTPDVFLAMETKPAGALLMSHLITPYTRRLIGGGVKPFLLTCQESPFIATRFYVNLRKYSEWFTYSMVFSGMEKRLSPKTRYCQMFFPNVRVDKDFPVLPFSEKKCITMISSNKHMGNLKKAIILKFFYGFHVAEIYSLRQKVIDFFADSGIFDLYGFGWESGGKNLKETENIRKVYKGSVESKWGVLNKYKFVFCFENAIFHGYHTDRIFDAMMAGSVPVYFGAPDISDLVPSGTFIDMGRFRNLDHLKKFLSEMDENTYNSYIARIQQYLHSEEFYKFTQEYFAGKVLAMAEEEFLHI